VNLELNKIILHLEGLEARISNNSNQMPTPLIVAYLSYRRFGKLLAFTKLSFNRSTTIMCDVVVEYAVSRHSCRRRELFEEKLDQTKMSDHIRQEVRIYYPQVGNAYVVRIYYPLV